MLSTLRRHTRRVTSVAFLTDGFVPRASPERVPHLIPVSVIMPTNETVRPADSGERRRKKSFDEENTMLHALTALYMFFAAHEPVIIIVD